MKRLLSLPLAAALIVGCGSATALFDDIDRLVFPNMAGRLDESFGTGGIVTTPVGSDDDDAVAVAIQNNGRIVVAGSSSNGADSDFALARYSAAGSLDVIFGGDGRVTTAIGSYSDRGSAIAIQSDGAIVMAGSVANASGISDFGVARYDTAGSPDVVFSTDGKVTTPIGSGDDQGQAIAIQSDGKIVAAGYSHNGSNYDFAVVRYTSTGALDATFDGDGKVTTSIGSGDDLATAVAIQGDGKIVVAGYSYNGVDTDFAIVRYTSTGALDTAFSGDGKVTTPVGPGEDIAYALAIQNDGTIVAAGGSYNGSNYDFAVVRYISAGALDTTFGAGGIVTTPIGSSSEEAKAVAIQNDGRIVVVGYTKDATGFFSDFAVVRYTSTGALDTTFGDGGIVITAIGPASDYAYGVAIQADGKIVVAGYSNNGANDDFALVRYWP